MMARYQVILAYDGADFLGFQRQASTARGRTIQSEFENALQRIGWSGRSILFAGRTDTGVHASGQAAAFDLEWRHSLQSLQAALNANLPADIAVQSVRQAKADFHPRYDALARRYQYRIFCQPVRNPLREHYAWRVWPPAALDRLQQAADFLVGVHDFAAFGSPTRPGGATIRQVFEAGWQSVADELTFEITANAFLYHMARRLVAFQVKIGQGELAPQAVQERLQKVVAQPVRELAPAHGLNLAAVLYDDDEITWKHKES
jgi:tRNA pseudouridine38-40 synthase